MPNKSNGRMAQLDRLQSIWRMPSFHSAIPASGERVQAGDQVNALCVSRLEVCQAIKVAAVANGDKAASYSSHPGRIGSATLLLKAGPPVSMIKLAGRWKGDTWSIYSSMVLQQT